MIDTKPEHRRLIFPTKGKNDPYKDLCSIYENLLKFLPSEREINPGKFFWTQQFLTLFYPADQRKRAWNLWRMTRSASVPTELANHTGWLFWWLFVSMFTSWAIFAISLIWGSRDLGMNPFLPPYISIPQTLILGCGGICIPLLDKLQAPSYSFGIGNLPMRLVGFSIGLVNSAYYANILAGLTTRPMSGKLARATEVFLRLQALVALPLIVVGNLIQPRWWLALYILAGPTPAMINILCYQLATRILKKAQGVLSTVPLADNPSLNHFGQWGTTISAYIVTLCFIWTGLHFGILHDVWTYVSIIILINIFTLCIFKSIILAPGVRGCLSRAFTIGERLEALAQRYGKSMNNP